MVPVSNVRSYGTDEAPAEFLPVRLGPLSFLYSADSARRICWHETELVRAVCWPIRDENWGTYAPDILKERHEIAGGTFQANLVFSVANGRLECALAIHATDMGDLRFNITMRPVDSSFATNRAGLTVLHPIKDIAGQALDVTHGDGQTERTSFPLLISPGQPVFDIQRLAYGRDGFAAEIAFSGEIFEMEDQRNWSDASYKTYCVPLVYPFTYEIDSTVTQSVEISLAGSPDLTGQSDYTAGLETRPSEQKAPEIGLVAQNGWLDTGCADIPEDITHLCARIHDSDPENYLADLSRFAQGRDIDLELVLPEGRTVPEALAAIADRIAEVELRPSRITALSEAYLASHQPSGPWPDEPTPADVIVAAREAFPGARIGGGMLTNFTEFNRCRPDPELCDFVTHANTAIVHACDDLSVCETLETLPQIFASVREVTGHKPYRLGLVSIGMRTNPYGAAVAENPEQTRRTMAREDPRQRGLFAAAWAVGVLAATETGTIDALCLAAPTGPFGIIHAPQCYPQAYYDEVEQAKIYPLFHVVKAAAAMAGNTRLGMSGMPDGVVGFGAATRSVSSLMVANASPRTRSVRLANPGRAVILDSSSFVDATTRPDWLEQAQRHDLTELELEGFAVAFID